MGVNRVGEGLDSFSIPLIDRNGKIVKRFHPTTTPEAIDAEIGTLLTKQEK